MPILLTLSLNLHRYRDPWGVGVGATYLRNSLNKKSICIDLKSPAGVELIKQLVPHFDVVGENFKPGTMKRLGLGYADLAPLHPGLVYVSVSGFGNRSDPPSPYREWAAYAPIVEVSADGEITWTTVDTTSSTPTYEFVQKEASLAAFAGYAAHVSVDYGLVGWVSVSAIAGSFPSPRYSAANSSRLLIESGCISTLLRQV